ncbi:MULTISPECIES: response regulator [Lysobacteraceae]|uniref:response regulator n=1 Tax=Lysobacteraceae TaxID=32033 RepID=UPI001BCEBB92|nr:MULTISPECIES: response regulator [Lysobacter]
MADDNSDITLTLSVLLASMGFEVHCASDGLEALAIAKRLSPDLLFLDIGMPGMDGWEVCRRVRVLQGDAPAIIAITGYGQDDDRARSLQAGFDAHVTKPLQHEALVGLVSRLSGAREPRAAPTLRVIAQAFRDALAATRGVLQVLQRDAALHRVDPEAVEGMSRQLDALEQSLEDLVDPARPARRDGDALTTR